MTAISPLQSIHKRGLFGDHHRLNEKDLLKISEIKNLTIIQIAKYNRSKVQVNDLLIDGLNLPLENLKVSSNSKTRILWSAPDIWLVVSSKENIVQTIEKECNSENFAVTNISHSRAIIQIKGFKAKEILKKGCPINFNDFKKNDCASSVFHGITIVVDCMGNDPQTFNLLTLRSFGESLYHHITDSALEFGYVGV